MMSYFVGSGEIPDASLQDEDIYYGRTDQNSIQSSLTEWIEIKIGFFCQAPSQNPNPQGPASNPVKPVKISS